MMNRSSQQEPRLKGETPEALGQAKGGPGNVGVQYDSAVVDREQPADENFPPVAAFRYQAEMQ